MPAVNESKILIVATHGFEQSELEVPRDRLKAAGATVHLATPGGEDIRGWKDKDWGELAFHDLELEAVNASEYDALVLPGGQMNPDILRMNETAVNLVRQFVEEGKIVAAICHGPWLLAEADVLSGKTVTSWPSLRTDLRNAGADVVDEPVIVSDQIVTSRNPGDLDVFCKKIMELLQKGADSRDAA